MVFPLPLTPSFHNPHIPQSSDHLIDLRATRWLIG